MTATCMSPHVINDLWQATGGDAIVTTDVGQHQMWAAQYYRIDKPNQLDHLGWVGDDGLWAAGGDWRQVCAAETRKSGRSPAMAVSR